MTTSTEPNLEPITPPADNYLGLVAAFRARVAELGISYETLDELAGYRARYSSKVLAEEPQRHLGVMAFDAMLGALVLKIAVIPDPDRTAFRSAGHSHALPVCPGTAGTTSDFDPIVVGTTSDFIVSISRFVPGQWAQHPISIASNHWPGQSVSRPGLNGGT
jgi:hypothetical protein